MIEFLKKWFKFKPICYKKQYLECKKELVEIKKLLKEKENLLIKHNVYEKEDRLINKQKNK